MLVVPSTENESERLKLLLEYHILDTPPEKAFDDIARLAKYICSTPISLITFIDLERQWFKARCGLSIQETPRDVAFCTYALDEKGLFVVKDAAKDPRFRSNPLVSDDPNIRFYAGSPLTTSNGLSLGTLCVIDRKPGDLSDDQANALISLSQQVVHLLELRKLSSDLEKMVQMRTRQLENTNENLSEALKSRDEFFAVASHELRTPLSSLRLKLQLIAHKAKKEENSQLILKTITKDLQSIDGDVQTASNTIDNLLEISRFRQLPIQLHLEEFDISDLLRSCISKYKDQAESCEILIHQTIEPSIKGVWDRRRMEQVFNNFLSNAIKYGQGKSVDVSLRSTMKKVVFEVRDHGLGISPEEQDIIFNRFESANSKRDVKGMGLGLYIVSQIVKAHQGTIELESELAKGSLFIVKLPLQAKDQSE